MAGPPRRSRAKKAAASNHDTSNQDGKKKVEREKQQKKKASPSESRTQRSLGPRAGRQHDSEVDISTMIPLTLQQLLLNVFKSALLDSSFSLTQRNREPKDSEPESNIPAAPAEAELDIKSLIQTIKSHLYNRDFESAFADANEDLLRAYALRWSASRALGYAGVLKGVCRALFKEMLKGGDVERYSTASTTTTNHAVCIGGGGGAEIVALAAVLRELMDEAMTAGHHRDDDATSLSAPVAEMGLEDHQGRNDLSLNERIDTPAQGSDKDAESGKGKISTMKVPKFSVTAVDIADWSAVVERLSAAIKSPAVPSSKALPAPLLPVADKNDTTGGNFAVSFQKSDILNLTDEELRHLLRKDNAATGTSTAMNHEKTILVTIMFTLNELFSTSMAKTTAFLLRMTDILEPGTILLVIDSPGSYSTVTLGKASAKPQQPPSSADENPCEDAAAENPEQQQQRNYPMKFLLDHTLLSVTAGKWDRILSQDSKWFRRDATKLRYAVGEGAGLEDMRFQIHIYRRSAD